MICGYLVLLVTVGLLGSVGHKRNSAVDYFLASRACGAFLLVMTIFGTTMTSFALVGSTGQAFKRGIGVYGQMASWSGLIHSACFFIIGTKLWYYGKRFGYSTQIQFFRDRFQSNALGFLLFPILVGLVVPYVVINILGSGATIQSVTAGAFPSIFAATGGGIPAWLGSAMVCLTVLTYVFSGGMRSLSFANALHASVLILLGGVILFLVLDKLGGAAAASALVAQHKPGLLIRGGAAGLPGPSHLEFMTYMFVPLSVGMFPHLFQHWMTAKDVKTFRPVVILHPIFIMLVWAPCILLGIWASTAVMPDGEAVVDLLTLKSPNEVLGIVVNKLTNPVVAGFLGVGIVSATMSLDSQFLALSSMFTHDILLRVFGEQRIGDKQRVLLGRSMVVAIVLAAYVVSLFSGSVYTLGVWCFTGFAGLFPLVFAALYWKRVTSKGAIASIIATAASWLYLFADSNWGKTEKLFLGMMPAASIVFVSAVTLIVISLVTKPPAREVVERFFPKDATEENAAVAKA
jgi:SSS family solute:Na+ symporter